ncbi:MAG: transglutaminase-like domain-containing protein, partial [Planctomycetota bacterium]
ISAFFLLLRKKKKKDKKQKSAAVNRTYPYFAICILSASAANVRDVYFYMGLFGLSALAFWFVRSKRYSVLLWLGLIAIAGGTGVAGHIGLHGLQLTLEQKGLEWFTNFNHQGIDPFQTKTAIGDIGLLKPSSKIIFRVKPEDLQTSPMLLREAIYDAYSFSMWFISNSEFRPVRPEKNRTSWRFKQGASHHRLITVSSKLYKGQGVLKLPAGAFQVDRLPVGKMERNILGTVKVEGGPGLVDYRVRFDKASDIGSPPVAMDLFIPGKEKPVLDKIASELGLIGKSPTQILKTVETFFQKNFSYSLLLSGQGRNSTPISTFLLQTRSGHCEYFATATVLLLRAAGLPARYVKGYSVHEFSQLENRFIVRDRHAHAWTLVHLAGAWYRFDTTPATWASIEDTAAPGWEFISDFLSFCWFKLMEGIRQARKSSAIKYLWWLVIPFVFILVRRLFRRKQVLRDDAGRSPQDTLYPLSGSDSEFYMIEKALNKSGFARHPSETLQNWIGKLQNNRSATLWIKDLRSILDLHYRYRFDPYGIKKTERAALKSGTQAWLDEYNKFLNSRTQKP